jgi:hypothetical protein
LILSLKIELMESYMTSMLLSICEGFGKLDRLTCFNSNTKLEVRFLKGKVPQSEIRYLCTIILHAVRFPAERELRIDYQTVLGILIL